MQAACNELNLWHQVSPVKVPGNDRALTFGIRLRGNSLFNSFLCISDESGVHCLIPISSEIGSSFSYQDSKLFLKFVSLDNLVIPFLFEDSIQLEVMVSHFGKVNLLSNGEVDAFSAENAAYLKSLAPSENVQWPQNMPPYVGSTTTLTPIVFTERAKSIWEKRSMELNTGFYIKEVPIRINFLTWNVASKEPTSEVLDDLSKIFNTPVAPADVVIVALEEIDMSVKSIMTGNSQYCEKWTEAIRKATNVNGNEPFEVIQYQSMGGVYCCGLARKAIVPLLSQPSIHVKKLGANGMLANKAAVIFRYKIGMTSLSSICCHLAAHDQNWEQRNNQWHEIAEDLKDDDYISFMGDLNYRINTTYEDCIAKVEKETRDLKYLYDRDQLHETQLKDEIIAAFKEPEIKFNPTFKYDMGIDRYDTSPKHRVPSWTDRILIKTAPKKMRIGLDDQVFFETDSSCNYIKATDIFLTDWNPQSSPSELNYPRPPENICYRSLKCSFSDHRPVHAAYKYPIPFVDEERKALLEEIISSKYEEMKILSYPILVTDSPTVDVQGQNPVNIKLINKSLVWVRWSAQIPKNFSVTPTNGLIYAADSIEISLKPMQPLPPNYSDSLVINVKNGKPLSINIKAR